MHYSKAHTERQVGVGITSILLSCCTAKELSCQASHPQWAITVCTHGMALSRLFHQPLEGCRGSSQAKGHHQES